MGLGPAEDLMLEGYSTLAYLAGVTKKVKLGTLVTGVIYRYPGILVKTVTTLDVLSGGRAYLGIGAAWNEREAWELFGVGFTGHPNLTCLLLPEGTEFRPLLKSFTAPPPSIYDDSLAAPAHRDEHPDPHAHG